MTLSQLLDGITVRKMFQTTYGATIVTQDIELNHVRYDSRKVVPGDLFVAVRGTATDGHRHIQDAVDRGALAVIMQDDEAMPDSFFLHSGVVKIVVPDSRQALARMSASYYDHPSDKLTMIGVTGTNGKTTTTKLIQSIIERGGRKTGLIGTIDYKIGAEILPATHTTPESLELQELLARMVDSGCLSAVMEVSSHALHQHRVDGIRFNVAIFTNLTQDHLDYHGSMEGYFEAKRILFDGLSPESSAIINYDDQWGRLLPGCTRAKVVTYGAESAADVRAEDISLSSRGTRFTIAHGGEETSVSSALIGRFNVSNVLASFAAGVALGIPKQVLREAIRNMRPVEGRFEQIPSPAGWTVIIDYAHTPDALEKVLKTVHDIFDTSGERGRVTTVFGCGGNRDRTKRPKMAAIASQLSDMVVVTSDNPRNEDPESIIDEVMTGARSGAIVHREVDRRRAIVAALKMARRGDIVLVAGKGHEEYQIIGDRSIHFNDREVVEEFLHLES